MLADLLAPEERALFRYRLASEKRQYPINPYDPNTPAGPPPAVSRKRHHYIRWILAGLGALILLIIVIGVADGRAARDTPAAAPAASASLLTSQL